MALPSKRKLVYFEIAMSLDEESDDLENNGLA